MFYDNYKFKVLNFHEFPFPGKLEVSFIKFTGNLYSLTLGYSPGVSEVVKCIIDDKNKVYNYTSKGNLIGVVTNGSAVLGFGKVGVYASKPVMESKAILFKKFSDINSFDIQIATNNITSFIDCVIKISFTFGAINLEDIKAPDCFKIEKILSRFLNIPVFHDDQHGTSIVVAASLLNAVELKGKNIKTLKIKCVGVGAAGISIIKTLLYLGLEKKNFFLFDSSGFLYKNRKNLNKYKKLFSSDFNFDKSYLDDLNYDIFIGVSGFGSLNLKSLVNMNKNPIVFALSNPNPEILPYDAYRIRKDLILATGRSDFVNQVNNFICFPYIFRAALDSRSVCINVSMKLSCVFAIKNLSRELYIFYDNNLFRCFKIIDLDFDFILPKFSDFRLINYVSKAIFRSSLNTGVSVIIGL